MDNLRIIREKKKVTQVRLSLEAGVSQETISSYECGKTLPRVEVLCQMADFLGASTDYLLDRTDIPTPVHQLTVDGLNARELELVQLFRKLNKEQQGRVAGFMMGMLE